MTRAQTKFKEAKVKGYVHWPITAWMELQKLAQPLDIPTHWVILAYQRFVSEDPSRLDDFRQFLAEYAEDQKSGNGWESQLVCPFCRRRNTNERAADIHRLNCEQRPKLTPRKILVAPVIGSGGRE